MTAHRAYIGIGSNLGDRAANLERAIAATNAFGKILRRSSLYRTAAWGNRQQPWFLNAVVLLQTQLAPHALLDGLKAVERDLGRVRSGRWGPRTIDLDLLLYDDLEIDETELKVPHPHLHERAFVLVPLSEIDDRFEALRDALPSAELAGVVRAERENAATMPKEPSISASAHVRVLAEFLAGGDAVRVRVQRGDDEIEIAAPARRAPAPSQSGDRTGSESPAVRIDAIKADIVGLFHLSRPTPVEGDVFEGDRELGYIEALGIRTPIHSMGAGRLVAVATADGEAVEYGQPLFLVARGK